MNKSIAVLLCVLLLAVFPGCSAAADDTASLAETGDVQTDPTATNASGTADSADAATPDTLPEEEPPAWQWDFDLPENQGMDAERLRSLHAVMEGTQISTMVIVRHGVIVDEFYQEGYDETSVVRLNSCSKSFSSAILGIAIDEGLIEGVDLPVSEFFPQLIGTDKEDITIREVLEHRSGMAWSEWNGSARSFWELNEADNWLDYVLEQPMAAAPGSTFNYTTGGSHLLTAMVDAVLEESVLDYARTRLFEPLGMDSVHWRVDPQGLPDGGNGIEMTARDAAKFGQLFLNGGSWDGRQVVPEAWVAESTAVHVTRNGTTNGSYGYQWWILPMAGYDTFYALGAGGQFIVVVPELDLVAVFTSEMPSDTNLPYSFISNYVIAACS